jgi:hypothetical protein
VGGWAWLCFVSSFFFVFLVGVRVRDGDGDGGAGAGVLSLSVSLFSLLSQCSLSLSLPSIRGSYVVDSSRCVAPLRIAVSSCPTRVVSNRIVRPVPVTGG